MPLAEKAGAQREHVGHDRGACHVHKPKRGSVRTRDRRGLHPGHNHLVHIGLHISRRGCDGEEHTRLHVPYRALHIHSRPADQSHAGKQHHAACQRTRGKVQLRPRQRCRLRPPPPERRRARQPHEQMEVEEARRHAMLIPGQEDVCGNVDVLRQQELGQAEEKHEEPHAGFTQKHPAKKQGQPDPNHCGHRGDGEPIAQGFANARLASRDPHDRHVSETQAGERKEGRSDGKDTGDDPEFMRSQGAREEQELNGLQQGTGDLAPHHVR